MTKNVACPICEGRGFVTWVSTTGSTNATGSKTCPHCGGTGVRTIALTKADRIRAMTDEELAYWMTHLHEDGHCLNERCQIFQGKTCEECVIDWLKQPMEKEKT